MNDGKRWAGWLGLTSVATVVVLVWCVLLPWASARPTVKQRLEYLDEQGIDASAMYYTELEVMQRILDSVEP